MNVRSPQKRISSSFASWRCLLTPGKCPLLPPRLPTLVPEVSGRATQVAEWPYLSGPSSHQKMISEPSAFMSYVRSDDDHDDGRITKFRKRLEGEVRMQSGKAFPIFQDRNDIAWGQHWKSVITDALSSVRFLIPIVTPSFFASDACRSEFETFLQRENMLGVPRLILPVYYVPCEQLEGDYPKNKDAVADVLRDRNWTDWRTFRFKPLSDPEVAATLASLARTIQTSIREIEPMIAAASAPQKSVIDVPTRDEQTQKAVESIAPSVKDLYKIPEITLNAKFDGTHAGEVRKSFDYYVYTTRIR